MLENDREWTVIPRGARPDLTALDGLQIPERPPAGAPGDRWRETAARPPGGTSPVAGGTGTAQPPSTTTAPIQASALGTRHSGVGSVAAMARSNRACADAAGSGSSTCRDANVAASGYAVARIVAAARARS